MTRTRSMSLGARVWSALLLAMLVTLSTPALAQNETKARELYNAGVAAYEDGKFLHAAQAFLEAHKLVPKPQLLFSAGQAFRRQYDSDGDQAALGLAVKNFSAYLAEVKEGGRRVDAARALGELRPLLRNGEGSGEMNFPTRLSVTSGGKNAVVSIDGGPWLTVPHNAEITPGPHKVVVRAAGYFEATREFLAEKGRVAPVDVPLRGIPPKLDIVGEDGAEVAVDGKTLGTAPLADDIALEPGEHFVAVTRTGHKPYSAQLDFAYGGTTQVDLDMPATNQRRVAWGVLAAGGGALVAAGVLAGLAFVEQNQAKNVETAQAAGPISEEQRLNHNASLDMRDDLRLAAYVVGGAGVVVTVTGLFLYLFDEPVVSAPVTNTKDDDETPKDDQPGDVEMMGAPIVSPTQLGFTLLGRF